jgi:hypothetical protein|tara:strand:+ start:795 stop:1163 length:369 start_codon:yes stop_codon:yes gene_type:complete
MMTDLCEVRIVGNKSKKYAVTWNKHMTGLDVYSPKVHILLKMILDDVKSYEVGIILSDNNVWWLSSYLRSTLRYDTLKEYLWRVARVYDETQILGAIFDNTDDVDAFTKRLEQKYIWHILKK